MITGVLPEFQQLVVCLLAFFVCVCKSEQGKRSLSYGFYDVLVLRSLCKGKYH